jgi:phosphoribosylaminoimidazole (AIR) synthetase
MGVGYVLVVDPRDEAEIMTFLQDSGEEVFHVGNIQKVSGKETVKIFLDS